MLTVVMGKAEEDGRRDELLASIVRETIVRIESAALPLPVRLDAEAERQMRAILDEAADAIEGPDDPGAADGLALSYDASSPQLQTGRIRASQRVHPAQSLLLADALFDTALPRLTGLVPGGRASTERVTRILHRAIWRRFPAGAIAYTEALRQSLFEADRESRLSVSRELHDRVAHGILAGIQFIELSLDPAHPRPELTRALSALRAAVQDVRGLAADLREMVGDRHLDEALRAYADATAAAGPRIGLTVTGSSRRLPRAIGEEAYMIVIEAIRNARTHALSATGVRVDVEWAARELTVTVADDGPGLPGKQDGGDQPGGRGIGLRSMQERADLIGATLSLESGDGEGTRVRIRVPVEGELR